MNIVREVAHSIDMQISEIQSLIRIFRKLAESLDDSEWTEIRPHVISGLYHLDDQMKRVSQPVARLTLVPIGATWH